LEANGGGTRVLDPSAGMAVVQTFTHGSPVYRAALGLDGTRVATAAYDGTARLWRADTGRPVGQPMRPDAPGLAAIFHPNRQHLPTASRDGVVKRWDARTADPLGEVLGTPGVVRAAALSGDGKKLALGGGERGEAGKEKPKVGWARVWDLETGAPL